MTMRAPEKIAEEMAARMRESFGFDLRGTASQLWLSNCIGEIIEDAEKEFSFTSPDGLHPDTAKLVRDFSAALAEKLLGAQVKYGYLDAWKLDHWRDGCAEALLAHVHKGDPRDVAAYCAFAWFHGWSVAPPSPSDIDERPSDIESSMIAASLGHRLSRKQAAALHDDIVVLSEEIRRRKDDLLTAMTVNNELRSSLDRIANMEKPPGGYSQMVGLMKQIARDTLEA